MLKSHLSPYPIVLGLFIAVAISAPLACSSPSESAFEQPTEDGDETSPTGDLVGNKPPKKEKEEDLYAHDPPSKWCGPSNGPKAPPQPGGTEECPDDKNKPGCKCAAPGETRECWTGLRANRNLGICKDGHTTCRALNEFNNEWGPCEGEVLPQKGAKKGKNACACFSEGQWFIENPVPCFFLADDDHAYAVSTIVNPQTGVAECPQFPPNTSIPTQPSEPWTGQTLRADCAGHFELCIALKGGDVANPKPSDCQLMKQCFEIDYTKENVDQALPPLDGWLSTDSACGNYFYKIGGYAEMSVKGKSVRCDAIDDGNGNAYVFHRWGYCPAECDEDPSLPACASCSNDGAGGSF